MLGLAAGRVPAAPLYRCQQAAGGTVYTTQTQGYRHCRWLAGTSRPVVSPPPQAPPAPARPKPPLSSPTEQPTAARRGAVYRITRRDGSVEYTNHLPAQTARGAHIARLFTYIETCLACDLHSRLDFATVRLQPHNYAQAIAAASADYGVDAALLRAVIQAESGFNPYAVSAKGAAGLMQLMPATAAEMGVRDVYDAVENIRGGARYLASLLKFFNGDPALATAAYNAGLQAVLRYGGLPPYPETRIYVQRVGLLWSRYHQLPAWLDSGSPR